MKYASRPNVLSSLLKQEHKRYVVLSKVGELSWYLSEQHAERGESKGSMSVRGAKITRVNTTNFIVASADDRGSGEHERGSRLPLHAESADACREWITLLSKWAASVDGPAEADLPPGRGWSGSGHLDLRLVELPMFGSGNHLGSADSGKEYTSQQQQRSALKPSRNPSAGLGRVANRRDSSDAAAPGDVSPLSSESSWPNMLPLHKFHGKKLVHDSHRTTGSSCAPHSRPEPEPKPLRSSRGHHRVDMRI